VRTAYFCNLTVFATADFYRHLHVTHRYDATAEFVACISTVHSLVLYSPNWHIVNRLTLHGFTGDCADRGATVAVGEPVVLSRGTVVDVEPVAVAAVDAVWTAPARLVVPEGDTLDNLSTTEVVVVGVADIVDCEPSVISSCAWFRRLGRYVKPIRRCLHSAPQLQ